MQLATPIQLALCTRDTQLLTEQYEISPSQGPLRFKHRHMVSHCNNYPELLRVSSLHHFLLQELQQYLDEVEMRPKLIRIYLA